MAKNPEKTSRHIDEFSKRLLSREEVAQYLGVTKRTIDQWRKRKGLPSIVLQGENGTTSYVKIHPEDLFDWIKSKRTEEPIMAKVKFKANDELFWVTADLSLDRENCAVNVLEVGTTRPIAKVPIETDHELENAYDRISQKDGLVDLTSNQAEGATLYEERDSVGPNWRTKSEMADFLQVAESTVKRRESRGELATRENNGKTEYTFAAHVQ